MTNIGIDKRVLMLFIKASALFIVFLIFGVAGAVILNLSETDYDNVNWLWDSLIIITLFTALYSFISNFINTKAVLLISIPVSYLVTSSFLVFGDSGLGYGIEAFYTLAFLLNPIFDLFYDLFTSLELENRRAAHNIIITFGASFYLFFVYGTTELFFSSEIFKNALKQIN